MGVAGSVKKGGRLEGLHSRENTSVYISVQQQDDEYQPKISFHQNKPVKNSQKEKESWCLGGYFSFPVCRWTLQVMCPL